MPKFEDSIINGLAKKYGEIVRKSRPNVFEDIVDSIISQQLSVKAAATILDRVKSLFADRKITPNLLLNLDDLSLRNCGMSWAKAKYAKDLATKTLDGTLQLDKLDQMSDQEIIDHLVIVKGVGQWTAEMILMFTLVRPDVFPVDDLGIQNAMIKLYGLKKGKRLKTNMLKTAEPWRPHRTIACWYLWKSLDNK